MGYHEIDSGYGSSELSVDAKVEICVTDKNANSGVLQQGLYAYYRVADKLKYQQGKTGYM